MRTALSTLLFLAMIPGAAGAEEHFACNMGAMTATERTAHAAQSRRLFDAVEERKELPDGYAFRLPADALTSAAGWVALERKCCPFFYFELDVASHAGPLWLRITGSKGIKPFIRAEFGLDDALRP